MIFETETCGTRHMTLNAFVDAFADMKPGDHLTYAFGDLAFSSGHLEHELLALKARVWKYYEQKRGALTQRRHDGIPFRPRRGASFEYIITKNREAVK